MMYNRQFNRLMKRTDVLGERYLNCISVKIEVSGKAPEETLGKIRVKAIELLLELEGVDRRLVETGGAGASEVEEGKRAVGREKALEWLKGLGLKVTESTVMSGVEQGLKGMFSG